MIEYILVFTIIISVPLLILFWDKLTLKSREGIIKRGFPIEWEKILKKNVRFYNYLQDNMKEKLKKDVLIFIEEKNFEGCGGIEMTDEIKITVAAQAMILFINRESNYYPKLISILVYPARYLVRGVRQKDGLVRDDVRLGESYSGGVVVLSWEDVLNGAMGIDNGENVALHEFSHQLDQEKGVANGMPILEDMNAYREWSNVFQSEYDLLNSSMKARMNGAMASYGMTNPAEFFAVATELFFEKPIEFKAKHEKLHEELKKYYKTDPCEWVSKGD